MTLAFQSAKRHLEARCHLKPLLQQEINFHGKFYVWHCRSALYVPVNLWAHLIDRLFKGQQRISP